MPDPTDPRAVADDPSGIVQQMPEGVAEVLIRVADANSADPALDDLSVTLAIQLADAEAEIALLRAEVERLRALAAIAIDQWESFVESDYAGTGMYDDMIADVLAARAALSPETDGGQDAPADS